MRWPGPAPSHDGLLTLVTDGAEASLHERLHRVLTRPELPVQTLRGGTPTDLRDAALALLSVHDLHLGPLSAVTAGSNRQHHPVVAELKWRLEAGYLERLEAVDADREWDLSDDPVEAVRAIHAVDRVPHVYGWLAEEATAAEVRRFLELDVGPGAGFDDLVAICQVGVDGPAKVELARNYWDETGRGEPARLHTHLDRSMAASLGLRRLPRVDLPLAALERMLLGTTLATNRWLQPELIGALGLVELQASQRRRAMVTAVQRIDAVPEALDSYEEHTRIDPRQGWAWLDRVVTPLVGEHPDLGWRIVRGARWRSTVDDRFLEAVSPLVERGYGRVVAAGTPA